MIGFMAFVYSTAILTIIAASGDDCNVGHPGLIPVSRNTAHLSYVENGAKIMPLNLYLDLEKTDWGQRRW